MLPLVSSITSHFILHCKEFLASAKIRIAEKKSFYFNELFYIYLLKIQTYGYRRPPLVVRVSGYRYRDLGFDSRRYQIF